MNKFLLAGAAIVFAGIGTTIAVASEHKASKRPAAPVHEPLRATVLTPARSGPSHKRPGHRRHHHHLHGKKHHPARRAHTK